MFSKEITGLTLTSRVASNLFQNINGDNFREDVSFLATLRALLYSRVPKEESVTLQYHTSNYRTSQIGDASPRDCVRAFLKGTYALDGYSGNLTIHSFEGSDADNAACYDRLDEGMQQVLSGYKSVTDLSAWIENEAKFKAKIYICEEKRNTIIFTDKLTMKKWHLLESLVTRYFPWYFSSAPLTEEELNLVKTLSKRYAPNYENAIEEFAKRFDFRAEIIRSKLKGFESQFDRRKLNDVRSRIESIESQMRELESMFSNYYREMNECRIQETGLLDRINNASDDESEMMEYFLLNKSIHLMDVSGGRIEFVVATTMANFDPDAAESMIRNKRSFFYIDNDNGNEFAGRMTVEQIERLFKEIFLKETLKLRLCAAYRLDFNNGTYAGIANYSFPRDVIMDHTPNQHIQAYHCLGQNEKTIRQSMRANDYVGAVAACVQSANSVNVTEGATCGKMMRRLFSTDIGAVIQLPDGSTKTPLDAVKWLEEQDVKAKKEQEEQEESHE